MTNEEKQAIIDKAKELGFNYFPSENNNSVFKNLFMGNTLVFNRNSLVLGVCGSQYYVSIKIISSPQDLEATFNAIVS